MTARRLLVAAALVVAAGAVLVAPRPAPVVTVAPGDDAGALAERHPGAVLELAAGRHAPFTITTAVTVRARPGAVVGGDIRVEAPGAVLEGLVVEGGHDGIVVRGVDGVVLDGVHVAGAELHGIEVVDATVTIRDCVVERLTSPFAQGIEIRNATGRGRSLVEGCRVIGGFEGITSHSARLVVRANHVTATTKRGIAVGEMSEGLVEQNRVEGVRGAGITCVDMSHCEVVANTVSDVAAVPAAWNSAGGHGIATVYYSTIRARGNAFTGLEGEPLLLLTGAVEVDRFPLSHWPPGWRGAWLAVPVAAGAIAGLAAVRWAAGALAGRRARRRPAVRAGPVPAAVPLRLRWLLVVIVLGGAAVQAFHMLEHLVQVWQVHVAHTQNRSGILGARADTEWVHFLFNAAVLAFVVLLWRAGRVTGALDRRGTAWVQATLVVQALHMVEHVAKLLQHLDDGVRTAPGVAGHHVNLVWLHYGINLAVFTGIVVVTVLLVRGLLAGSPAGRHRPARQTDRGTALTIDVDEEPARPLEGAGV